MYLLALETTSTLCGVALVEGSECLANLQVRHGMNLSGTLLHATEWALQRAGLELEQVDAFAVDVGPGAFTGLKIGVMIAKSWAHAFQKPLIAVRAFEACACRTPAQRLTLVALPARRDALYLQWLVPQLGGIPIPVTEPAMVVRSELERWYQRSLAQISENLTPRAPLSASDPTCHSERSEESRNNLTPRAPLSASREGGAENSGSPRSRGEPHGRGNNNPRPNPPPKAGGGSVSPPPSPEASGEGLGVRVQIIGTARAYEGLQPLVGGEWVLIESPPAEGVAQVGMLKLQAGETIHPFQLVPFYLQPPSITLPKSR